MSVTDFLQPLLGGVLIGLAAMVLAIGNRQTMGISGILKGVWENPALWRVAFLLGLAVPAIALVLLTDFKFPAANVSLPVLLIAGLLVGFGTRMGNGCTSGHGICGLGRFSLRSLVAVLCFMASAAVTVFVVRHVVGGF